MGGREGARTAGGKGGDMATFGSETLAANHRRVLDHLERQGPCRWDGRKLTEGEPVWEIE